MLSTVPKEVTDRRSPAWNKGRIHYSNSTNEVVKAYEAQYAKDMENFLKARAEEIVQGGLLTFIVPGRPNEASHSEASGNKTMELLGSCLIEMVNKGKISGENVDSFNWPLYLASPQEVEAVIKRNGCFSIETIEHLPQQMLRSKEYASTLRACMGGTFKKHFGEEILDEFFDLLNKKFEENLSFIFESGNAISLFVLLKRIVTE
ncbi:hypothetical protein TIFTF001_044296 [Ficus carica]|uniref:SAM dependent carboxyl methyltransferase n=1 Tax=Ficus carica TaxID=3494 RepID=A0AA87ZCC5_FICCA|nr:hypothetical protein TIFTF001_044265 [Ficus carica]GMN28737.1 hypothetical protein TIFTF001_044268 [Ficus carica]GMN28935.1 hypothetical protein TIFTF001_044293 [Ficus carica]GMN28951.1 hypothetical protein TIFTF001_044296 [Ficus carica]